MISARALFRHGLLPALASFWGLAANAAEPGRAVDTDPANFVEGPYTLEAGRAQAEIDLFSFARNRYVTDGTHWHTATTSISALKLRGAITANCEWQLVHDGYLRIRERDLDAGSERRVSGFGDTTVRLKANVFGNDGGRAALAVAAYGIAPTGSTGIRAPSAEWGGVLAFSVGLAPLPGGALSAGSQVVYHRWSGSHLWEWSQSLLYGIDLAPRHSLAIEFNTRGTNQDRHPVSNSSVTWSWQIRPDSLIDLGCSVGLSRSCDDFSPYLRFTRWF